MRITESRLPSGLRVVSAAIPGVRTAAVAAVVRTGADQERAEEAGLAHFLEHMAFKGTGRRSALDIAREIEVLGARINAFTDRELTVFYVSGLARHLGAGARIVGDILTDPRFRPEDVETERGVIRQEILGYADQPDAVAQDLLDATVYPDHPRGRPILGTAAHVDAFGPGHFEDFRARGYACDTVSVMAAGDVDHADLERLAAEAFAALPSASGQAAVPAPVFRAGVAVDRSRTFEQATAMLAFPTPGASGSAAHEILASALGGGMSSPLFQEVRERRGLVYSVGSFTRVLSDAGRLTVWAQTSAEKVQALLEVAAGEIRRIAEEGPTAADLERARNARLVAIAGAIERPMGAVLGMAEGLVAYGRIRGPEDVMAEVEAVSAEDVRRAAQAIVAGPRALALVGPVAPEGWEETLGRAFA